MANIPQSHQDIIERSEIIQLGTIGPDGEPQITALWFHFDGDTVRMSIADSRQKLRNLQRDPRTSALFVDPENPYRTIELRGRVDIEPDPNYEFASKVGEKYKSDLREMDGPGENRAVVTLVVNKVNTFG